MTSADSNKTNTNMSHEITLRDYQQRTLDALYGWWMVHPDVRDIPIMVCPTGSGKSVILAELTRLLFDTWPEYHPRTVMLVPSKELAEQNAEKLSHLLPSYIRIGYYSASLGRKCPDADVIVATIGSIYKHAHVIGNIKCVLIDECHLVSPDGTEAGRYRQFLADLSRYCTFRVAGCTATPFRGNGYWLTEGKDPLFTGIAHEIRCQELLTNGFLAPLKPPDEDIETRIDTDDLRISGGDFVIRELSERVNAYLPGVVRDSIKLASARNKWIAFTATVDNANTLANLLNAAGVATVVVCGETPKQERADSIARFRAGEIRCLVTVTALATGFDVPDVDCILWCRPTRSPVLFIQGAGRGLRPAPGKENCLWLDFSDTTERLGPVDAIRGRAKPLKRNSDDSESNGPSSKVCDECGNRVIPASLLYCPGCGFQLRDEFAASDARTASTAPIMAHQMRQRLTTYQVTDVRYSVHHKAGSPDSMRVDYYSGLLRFASEWVCFEHSGFARAKAERWWDRRKSSFFDCPSTVREAVELATDGFVAEPLSIIVNEFGKFPEIVRFLWTQERANMKVCDRFSIEEFETLLDEAEAGARSSHEVEFVSDMRDSLDYYADQIFLSDRQLEWLESLAER